MRPILLVLILAFGSIVTNSCSKDDTADNPNRLAVDESKTFEVFAAERWNFTMLEVEAGETYRLTSAGTWIDLNIETDANGFSDEILDAFSHLKRNTDAKWFELIASIDTTSQHIVGGEREVTFNESGTLSLFANDAEGFYGNNSGSINTTITRLE